MQAEGRGRRIALRTAYLDCFSGISGDMCLGSLVDAGVPLEALKKELKKLPVKGYGIESRKVRRGGLSATRVSVGARPSPPRRWKDIRELIGRSTLSRSLKDRGLGVFRGLFEAEAKAHGVRYDRAHLHELGAVDAVVDIMGTLICLEVLGVHRVFSSPVNVGGGTAESSHGMLPVPAPATAELLMGVPAYSSGIDVELTTPTGAAILKGLSPGFGPMPAMLIESVGTGAGERDTPGRPNVLRVFIGSASASPGEEVTVIETNIDDMNPQIYGHLMDRLFEEGALDVFLTQGIMKKGRPGVKLTVLSPGPRVEEISDLLFRETTTIGLRLWNAGRLTLPRGVKRIETEYGPIRVKEATLGGRVLKAAPEYDDLRRAARKHRVPIAEVIRAAGKKTR
jgi:uncharacterized protein (TIGR00299 family) protein